MTPSAHSLSRESFIENALWIGLSLASRGAGVGDNLDFQGNLNDGAVDCNDGQGSDFLATWSPSGVVVLAHDFYRPTYQCVVPPVPAELRPLVERASPQRRERATGALWISGDSSVSTLPPAERSEVLSIIDAICGPSLVSTAEADAPEKVLLDAMVRGASTITSDVARVLLRPETVGAIWPPACSTLDAGRRIAKTLGRFGFQWPDLELHVEELRRARSPL